MCDSITLSSKHNNIRTIQKKTSIIYIEKKLTDIYYINGKYYRWKYIGDYTKENETTDRKFFFFIKLRTES